MAKQELLDEQELQNIKGGEPEEFDWHTKDYVTPEKPEDEGTGNKFHAYAAIENYLKTISCGAEIAIGQVMDYLKKHNKQAAINLVNQCLAGDEPDRAKVVEMIENL